MKELNMNKYIGPIKNIPLEFYDAYTMNGKIPVIDYYIEEATMDERRYNRSLWKTEVIDRYVGLYEFESIRNNLQGNEMYQGISLVFLNAFLKYLPKNCNVAVIGSIDPWIESICLNSKAKSVTTVEYNVPVCDDPRIKTLKYEDFEKNNEEYDAVISYSSIEHSGLGRYGDPLNPDGDFEAMQTIKSKLKKDGVFFWGAPVGTDVLVWNAHRIYGKVRLPYIFKGFKDVEWFGCSKNILDAKLNLGSFQQPLIVLKHE